MTPLQQAIADDTAKRLPEFEAALRRCRNQDERYECIAAYGKIARAMQDMIGQQFGLPGMLYRDPRPATKGRE